MVVRDPRDGKIRIYTKGADGIVFKLLNKPSQGAIWDYTAKELSSFSRIGLRTLVVAYKEISEAEFVVWYDQLLKARADNMRGDDLVLVLAPKARPTEMIGSIGLHRCGAREARLDFWLGKPFWSQGYMSEAARALLDTAFSLTDLSAVHAMARLGDVAARHVLEACGFQAEGSGVETAPARGGTIPVERFALSRSQQTLAELTMTGRGSVPPHMQTA